MPQGCPNSEEPIQDHDCIKALKDRIKDLEGKQKAGCKSDEYVEGFDLAKVKCGDCNCRLRKMIREPESYGGSARCDICNVTGLEQVAFFFHCTECDAYDLCFGCALAN